MLIAEQYSSSSCRCARCIKRMAFSWNGSRFANMSISMFVSRNSFSMHQECLVILCSMASRFSSKSSGKVMTP